MVRDALSIVEEVFSHNQQPMPNLELGRTTLESLKTKLDDMLRLKDWDKETPFDYNEVQLIYAALHMYLADLALTGNEQRIPVCMQLCKQFSAIIESIPRSR